MKDEVSYKINEYNHRLSSKIDDFVMLSSFKKDQQFMYQPIPVYLPPMYPSQMYPQAYMPPMPQYVPDDEDYEPYQQPPYNMMYPNQARKKSKKPFKMINKKRLMTFRKAVFAVLFTIRLQRFA
jgi:hypothetical protein